jgi:hypothetical protein
MPLTIEVLHQQSNSKSPCSFLESFLYTIFKSINNTATNKHTNTTIKMRATGLIAVAALTGTSLAAPWSDAGGYGQYAPYASYGTYGKTPAAPAPPAPPKPSPAPAPPAYQPWVSAPAPAAPAPSLRPVSVDFSGYSDSDCGALVGTFTVGQSTDLTDSCFDTKYVSPSSRPQ